MEPYRGSRPWGFALFFLALCGPVLGFLVYHLVTGHEKQADLSSYQPWILGLGAFLLWEMLVGITLTVVQRRNSLAQREEKRYFDAAFRSMTEGIVVADSQGKLVFFNPAAERMLGAGIIETDPAEWSKLYGCYYPDTTTPFPSERLPLARALGGEESSEEIFVRNSKTTRGLWIRINGSPLRDEQGALCGGVVGFRDVSASKKSEEIIRRLSNAVEQTADAVFITDRNGVIEYVNPAFEAVTGFTSQEALGQTPRILKSGKHPPDYYESLWQTILAGRVFQSTNHNRRKNGELYHAEQTITPIKDAAGQFTHFVSLVKDVTERVQRQERDIEMHYAALVQRKLYPERPPVQQGFDIAGAVFSAEATCGDCYDYIRMPGGALGIAIGDVCGHGIGPALIMAETRAYLRSWARIYAEPEEILLRLNQSLFEDLEEHRYVTLMFVRIDTAVRRLVYASAGHPSGCILDRRGSVRALLNSTGLPLGMFEDAVYPPSESYPLEAGDIVVLVTDGITEYLSSAGQEFGLEGALEVVRAHREVSAAEIVRRVHGATQEFGQGMEQNDDLTLVVIKVS